MKKILIVLAVLTVLGFVPMIPITMAVVPPPYTGPEEHTATTKWDAYKGSQSGRSGNIRMETRYVSLVCMVFPKMGICR